MVRAGSFNAGDLKPTTETCCAVDRRNVVAVLGQAQRTVQAVYFLDHSSFAAKASILEPTGNAPLGLWIARTCLDFSSVGCRPRSRHDAKDGSWRHRVHYIARRPQVSTPDSSWLG